MKRKLFFAAGFFLITFAFTSCEALSNCKICQQNTYDLKGNLIVEGNETEYCDAALIKVEATPDVNSGITISKWECR
jgi:hypothetical protein